MRKRWWKHKTLPMIAVSVQQRCDGPCHALVRVNRHRTFQQPIALSLVTDNFDECTEAEYDAALTRFPDHANDGTWEIDIVTGAERQVFLT